MPLSIHRNLGFTCIHSVYVSCICCFAAQLTSTQTSDLLASIQVTSHAFVLPSLHRPTPLIYSHPFRACLMYSSALQPSSHPPKSLIYSCPLRSHLTHLSTLLPTLHPLKLLDLLVSTQAAVWYIRPFCCPPEPLIYSRPLRSCLTHSFTLPPGLHQPKPLIYLRLLRSRLVHLSTLLPSLHPPVALDLLVSTQATSRHICPFAAHLNL